MRFIKEYIILVLPIVAILFSAHYLIVFERALNSYETKLKDSYSVIVVAENSLVLKDLESADILVQTAQKVDTSKAIKKIEGVAAKESIDKLKDIIPLFVSVKLKKYSDPVRMQKLKKALEGVKGVKSVHIFEKVHDKMYSMMLFMKKSYMLFSAFIFIISFVLVVSQMRIWQYEHLERMQIMALFGAPVWLRSGALFKQAFLAASISLILVFLLLYYLSNILASEELISQIGVDGSLLFKFEDILLLAGLSFFISIFSALWVVVRFKEEQ